MSLDPVDPTFGLEERKTCRHDGALMAPFLPPFAPAHRQCPICGLVEAFGWRWYANVDPDLKNPWGIADESIVEELTRKIEAKRQRIASALLAGLLILAGCRSFEQHPLCGPEAPCHDHAGQPYCYLESGEEWVCCRCPR